MDLHEKQANIQRIIDVKKIIENHFKLTGLYNVKYVREYNELVYKNLELEAVRRDLKNNYYVDNKPIENPERQFIPELREKKKVRIIKCSDAQLWYNEYVGSIIEVVEDKGELLTKDAHGYNNIVKLGDIQFINDEEDL